MDKEKGFGLLVIILIWGGLLYFLANGSLLNDTGADKFLSSVFSSFTSAGSAGSSEECGIKGVIAIFKENGEEKFEAAEVHFDKPINVNDVKISPNNPKLLFAVSNYGLFISRDAGFNWYNFSDFEHKINSSARVYKILLTKDKSYVSVFKNNQGAVYESEDDFFSLKKLFEIQGEAIYDFGLSGGNLYLGLSNGQLLLYSLKKNEVRVLTNLKSPITQLEVKQGGNLIYLTLKSGGFWVSMDAGQSFSRQKFLDDYRGANKISKFLISSLNDYLVYAATDYGFIRSLDGGASWRVFKSLPNKNDEVSALGLKEDLGEIFVASGGKIYESRDNGLNWRIFDPEFDDREISVINGENKEIIIGTKK
jgi:photosystem II stability/assembly factor-like uncharacterized protein